MPAMTPDWHEGYRVSHSRTIGRVDVELDTVVVDDPARAVVVLADLLAVAGTGDAVHIERIA